MTEQSFNTFSIIALAGAGVALIFVLHIMGLLGRKYAAFVDKHITSMRNEFRKQSREANKAMSELIDRLQKGGDSDRETEDRVLAMDMELNRLTLVLERLENKGKKPEPQRKSA